MIHRQALIDNHFSFFFISRDFVENLKHIKFFFKLITFPLLLAIFPLAWSATLRNEDGRIEIVEGEKKTRVEYWKSGKLAMIKIIPKKGKAYYLVPADGKNPSEGIKHESKLYPEWVIVDF